MTIDIEPLKKELGRKIEDEDVVTQAPLKAMIATFDRPDKLPAELEAFEPPWHVFFLHSYSWLASLGKECDSAEGCVLSRIPMRPRAER
jgi:3-methylfumaryl-CoA hydratase